MVAIINTVLLRVYTAAQDLKVRLSEERGQDLLEYALLSGMVAIGILAAAVIFTPALRTMATGIKNCIDFTSSTVCDPGP